MGDKSSQEISDPGATRPMPGMHRTVPAVPLSEQPTQILPRDKAQRDFEEGNAAEYRVVTKKANPAPEIDTHPANDKQSVVKPKFTI